MSDLTLTQVQNIGQFHRSRENPNKTTDAGNAERLVLVSGHDLRYAGGMGWLKYADGVWTANPAAPVQDFLQRAIPHIYATASTKAAEGKTGADAAIELAKHAKRSEATARVLAAIELAKCNPKLRCRASDFDSDPWILNCKNGVVNLRTGELMAHKAEFYCMRQANTDYRLDAECPTWERTVRRIFNDNLPLIGFIQRAFGYTLTGLTGEQCWFIPHGCGANGKSTILNTLLILMGSYAGQAPPDLLLQSKSGNNRHPAELADLLGKRYILAQESAEGALLDEAKIKQISGQDRLSARKMHQDFFEFTPICKVWLSTNHRPVIRDTTHSTWRRIRLIPFNTVIPEHERDSRLSEKLQAELPGILRWAVDGCLEWQRIGLNAPVEVTSATNQYRFDSDVIGQFVDDICSLNPLSKIKLSALYAKYADWARESGRMPVSDRRLSESLQEKGLLKKRFSDGFYILGLQMKTFQPFSNVESEQAEAIPDNSSKNLSSYGDFMGKGSETTLPTFAGDDCEEF